MSGINRPIVSRMGFVIVTACLATSGAVAQSGGRQHIMVLEGGTLIDGTGRAPVSDPVIVVEANRIKAVGKKGQVQIPAGAQIIKTDGRTILPGLIDSHTHTKDYHIPMFLHYGITTIQDKSNDVAWLMAEREALENGTIKGPRMFNGGEVGGSSGRQRGFYNQRDAVTLEEAKTFTQTMIDNGVNAININQQLTDEQLKTIIAMAKAANIPVMGHTRNIRAAAGLGYKFQEHFFSMGAGALDPQDKLKRVGLTNDFPPEALADPKSFPDLISYMVKQEVFVNPTLVTQWSASAPAVAEMVKETTQLAKDPDLAFVPIEVRNLWTDVPEPYRAGYSNVAEFLREYVQAGGKVTVGTDSGYRTIPGLSEHYEMKMLVDVGIPPMQVLQAATLWNAQVIQKDKDLGSVEPGKLADFTIIEGDPLANIRNTENIRMVIKDGVVMDTKYDPKWFPPVPAPFSTYTINPPVIKKVSPAVVHQGGQTVTLQIEGNPFSGKGAGYKKNTIVRFDNMDLPTTFVSETKLTATLDSKLLQGSPGFYPLYVVTPGLYGIVSTTAYLVIDTPDAPVRDAPVPYPVYANAASYLIGPSPRMARQGGQTVTLKIEGNNFAPNAIVRFDTVDLPTTYVSKTKVTATVDAKLLNRPVGSYVLYVLNPGVYGSVSKAGYFQVGMKNSKVKPWLEFPGELTN